MINKQDLKEYIQDNTEWGLYEDSPFFIIPGWNVIRGCNQFQGIQFDDTRVCSNCKQSLDSPGCGSRELGGHYPPYITPSNVLDFDKLLGFLDSPYPFPINEEDITRFQYAVYYSELLQNGQLAMEGYTFEWLFRDISPEIVAQILAWYDNEEGSIEDKLYWTNDHIRDEITEVEWGFSDEHSTCDNGCGNIFRTSPDSYGWTPEYYESDYDRVCKECAQDRLDECIAEIQERLDNGESPKSLPHIFDITSEWVNIPHPVYEYSRWENGLHPGQNDSPLKQGEIVRGIKQDNVPLFQVMFRVFPSQFTVEWDTYIRLNPELDVTLDDTAMNEWVKYFSELFDSPEGRTKYDQASLMSQALKNTGKGRFNKITVDPEEGSINIQSTDNYDEFTSM